MSTLPTPQIDAAPTISPGFRGSTKVPSAAEDDCEFPNPEQLSISGSASLRRSLEQTKSAKIMIIDDEPLVIRVVRRFLQSTGYTQFIEITESTRAMEAIQVQRPDVILLDINMPLVTGLDILRARQNITDCVFTPVIILSADSDAKTKHEALQLGATEFLKKPVDPHDLILRVQNALIVKAHQNHLSNYAEMLEREVEKRTEEVVRSREQIIHCLARAAEYRDNETGQHVVRVGKYAAIIADELGFDKGYCHQIELAAQLHDVGKIGVPDSILMNPNRLDAEQMAIMSTHCDLGLAIIGPLAESELETHRNIVSGGKELRGQEVTPLLKLASSIALTHHEKWDGNGYPRGIKGEDIPIEGRITTVADVFDALSTKRPYKEGFPLKKCLEIMNSEKGTRFEPRIFAAFLRRFQDVVHIYETYADIE